MWSAGSLASLAHDAAGLRAYWARVPESDRLQPKVARAAAKSFLELGSDREAADILARCLERNWDSGLAVLYAECRAPDATRQLETAERSELWGKAQTYLEASLALDNHWRAHVALADLFTKLDRPDEASAHRSAALTLALAELAREQ